MHMRQLAIWLAAGFIISVGMSLGGMAHLSSLYFFDPFRTGENALFEWSMLILFCAGLAPTFLYNVVRPFRGGAPLARRHWGLTIGLGTIPAAFYFLGPQLFPLDQTPGVVSWPVWLSVRSLVAVPTFMAAVFVCLPLFNFLLGS